MLGPAIYLLAALGGVATMLGAVVFLFLQKTVVDQAGHVTDVEVPFFGRLKTNTPSIALCFLGAVMTFAVVTRVEPPRPTIDLSAEVGLAPGVAHNDLPVFVAAVPQDYLASTILDQSGKGHLTFPVALGPRYSVVILKPHEITEDGITRWQSTHGEAARDEDRLHYVGVLR